MARGEKELRAEISELVKEYYGVKFALKPFEPGKSQVRYAGRVFDEKELQSLVDASLDFWLTSGRYSEAFETAFCAFTGAEYSFLVNSGSSANLIAFASLTSPLLGKKRLKPGDEVISVAAGFPTTVNPIIQNGMIPVFVDVEIGTYNIDVKELEKAIGPKTKAIFLAHTLGNPYDLDAVMKLVKKHDLRE
jgi:CDP-6-deoxy-D-xylo-4-hexulose-3-dehydrase